jgi:hypothetical protein
LETKPKRAPPGAAWSILQKALRGASAKGATSSRLFVIKHREKGKMRKLTSVVGVLILILSSVSSFAIEGLKVSVQSTNILLSWPSATNETYIAQYRPSLTSTSSWMTLTNYLPAATNATVTFFSNSPAGTNRTAFYRVVRDGAHIYGLTNNSTLSGEVQMPIEIAVDSTDHIESVTFFNSADDSPVIGASAYTNSAGGWVFDWNTSMVENGSNNIYAEVDFTGDDPVSSDNLPVSLNVSNIISFPNYFTRIFGSQMWIYAETIPDVSYEIDMYDEGTNYLGSFTGSADDSGEISFIWDLTDGEGDTFDSTNFLGVFTMDTSSLPSMFSQAAVKSGGAANFQTASLAKKSFSTKVKAETGGVHPNTPIYTPSSSSSATNHWAIESVWSGNDKFVVAYAPLTDPAIDPNTSYRQSLMMVGGAGGEDGGVVSSLANYGFGYQLSPGNVAQSSAFEMGGLTDKTNLLSYLADGSYRNFYFFGHGNPTVISAFPSSGVAINAFTISQMLGNFLSGAKPENFHPYRLVFINGCDNGKGKFCEAFGIPAQTLNNSFFATAGVRSRAFLGFKKSISFNTAQWEDRSIMLGTFFGDWMSFKPLNQCVQDAQNMAVQPMDSSAVIYGATDLQKNTPDN